MKKSTKLLSAVLSLMIIVSSVSGVVFATSPLSGTGTDADPYVLGTKADLEAFAEIVNSDPDACAILTDNIEMDNTSVLIGTADSKFGGVFNGNGYSVQNYKSDSLFGAASALFDCADGAIIKNLTITGEMSGVGNFGGFGRNVKATQFINCTANVNCTAGVAGIGGFIGGLSQGENTFDRCIVSGKLSGTGDVAGFSINASDKCTNCIVDADVPSSNVFIRTTNNANNSNNYINITKVTASVGIAGYANDKTTGEFVSGDVTSAANNGAGEEIFGQLIGTDKRPVFLLKDNSNKVYTNTIGYSNDASVDGSADKPYLIGTSSALNAFGAKVNSGEVDISIKLISDIDLGGAAWSMGTNKYKGNFNGNNHEISNWKVSGDAWIGFFNRIDGAVISNLKLKGEVSGTVTNIGGFVGMWSGNGKISNCISDIKVTSPNGAAGFVGWSAGAASGTVENCIFIGECTGAVPKAFTGDPNITVSNSYYLNGSVKNTTGEAVTDTNGISKTQTEFKSGEVAAAVNTSANQDIYGQIIGTDNYPAFASDSNRIYVNSIKAWSNSPDIALENGTDKPYSVNSVSALKNFAELAASNPTVNVKLTNDIDLNNTFSPIGTTTAYSGIFDGQDHAIKNMYATGVDNTGLFKQTNGAVIKNLTVIGSLSGPGNLGGFVGNKASNTAFEKCVSKVNMTENGGAHISGFLGVSDGTNTFTHCIAAGEMNAEANGIISAFSNSTDKAVNCLMTSVILGGQDVIKITQCPENENCYADTTPGKHTMTGIFAGYGIDATTADLANGNVAFKLGDAFGQTLSKSHKDAYPVFRTSSNTVYSDGTNYFNYSSSMPNLAYRFNADKDICLISSEDIASGIILKAVYKNNVLTNASKESEPLVLTAGQELITDRPEFVDGEQTAKVFIFDDLSTIKPILKAIEYK